MNSFKLNSNKIVIKASRKIERNEQIFNCYGPHHLKMSLFQRKQSLIDQYKFKCECEACKKQLDALKSNQTETYCGLRCVKCKSHMVHVEFSQSESQMVRFEQMLTLKCEKCQQTCELKEYAMFFEQMEALVDKLDFTIEAKINTNIKLVGQYLSKFKMYLLVTDNFELDSNSKCNESEAKVNYHYR
jgi:hypothetical protein